MNKKAFVCVHKRAFPNHDIGPLKLPVPVSVDVLSLLARVDAPLSDEGPVGHKALAAGRDKHEGDAVADSSQQAEDEIAGFGFGRRPIAVR